jgi:hypothetical protein
LAAPTAETVHLEAYYPHTSAGFLIASSLLFAGLTIGAGFTFWPAAIPFALVTLYLLRFTLRQARGATLAIRVTSRTLYYRGWERVLPGGRIPLHAIASIELVKLRSAAAAGPVIAIWLSNPDTWRRARSPFRWARELSSAGDLAIPCDETDRTAEQVRDAIETALTEVQT